MGGVVDVVGVGDEVGVAMCPGDGCPQLAKTRRHLTGGRASAILSVGPAREFCILVGLPAGSAGPACSAGSAGPVGPVGPAGPAVLPRLATGLQILTFRPLPIKPHEKIIGKG